MQPYDPLHRTSCIPISLLRHPAQIVGAYWCANLEPLVRLLMPELNSASIASEVSHFRGSKKGTAMTTLNRPFGRTSHGSHSARTAALGTKVSRKVVAQVALVGLALTGFGAAATSAAWTDNVYYAADATSGSIDLKGSLDQVTWSDTTSSSPLSIPSSTFALLVPGAAPTVTVYLENTGTSPITLATPTITTNATGVFSGATPAVVSTSVVSGDTIAAGAIVPVTVTVTAPSNWPTSYQGLTGGTISLVFGASS